MQYRIYRENNYIYVVNNSTLESQYGHVKDVFIDKSNKNVPVYRIFEVKDFDSNIGIKIQDILKEDGSAYTQTEFEDFYTQNTGNFNSGGTAQGVQSVTGAGVDNTDPANPVINIPPSGVQTISGTTVDNTDPENPIINAIEEAPTDGGIYGRQNGDWVSSSVVDATTTLKGIVKLAGDLGGTADLPTTPTAIHKTGDETKTGQLIVQPSNTALTALQGISSSNAGVNGSSTSASGVVGSSDSNYGVTASSVSGTALFANTSSGTKIASFAKTSSEKSYVNDDGGYVKVGGLPTQFLKADGSVDSNTYQPSLVSGTTIKTVNSNSLLGSGNLETFNRSFTISDDNFEDGINSDLTLSTGWSVGADGIAISSSGGWGNSALYNKYTTIDRVSTRALIQVITTTSIFSIIRKPTGLSQFGTVAQVDLTAMRLNFYASWDGSTTVPSVAKFVAIPFSIVANRKYLVELTKVKAISVFTFTDETNPANTISLSFNQETEGISAIGRQWTSPGVMFNSGSIKLKRFTYATAFPNAPKLLITGHSFVEGYALIDQGDVSKTYSNLMYDALIGNVAIAGRGGETITSINTRDDINFFSPTYHLVDIGSNDTVYATWLSGIQTYIAKIVANGAIPVLATIVPRSDRQAFINQCNDWIRLTSGYNYVDFAKAVTVGNDGITQDASLFWTDSVHPNIAGNAKMFQQLKIDAPYLWDGYTKPAVANLDIVEVSKTASFTVALADAGKTYVINSASAVVVTFPTAMTAGKWWEFLSIGAGAVTFIAGASATLISPDNRLKLRAQYSTARIFARASNQGSLGGDIVL